MATKEIKELHALIDGTSYPAGVEAARRDSKGKIINETYLAGVYDQGANKINDNFITTISNYRYLKIIGLEKDDQNVIPSLSVVRNLVNSKITQGAEYLGTTDTFEGTTTKWSVKQPDTAGDWGRYTGKVNGNVHNGDILIYNGTSYDIVHAEMDLNTYYGVKVNSNIVLQDNILGYLNLVDGNKISFAKNANGTVTANHATYTAQSVTSNDYIKSFTSDGYGHVTGVTGGTAGVISSDNTIIMTTDSSGNVSLGVNVEKLPGQVTATKPIVATQNNSTKVYDISLLTGAGLSTAGDELSVSLPGAKTTGSGNVVKDVSVSGAQITQEKTLVVSKIRGIAPNAEGNFTISQGSNITITDNANGITITSAGGTIKDNDVAATGRTYIAGVTSSTAGNITTSYYKSNAYFESFKSTSDYSTASIDATTGVVSLTVKA